MTLGKKAPEFKLKDKDGVVHSLGNIDTPHVCIFFYPKDNTPGCTLEAKEFTACRKEFSQKGCTLVGISGGDEKSKTKFCENNSLEITLLSDPDYRVSKAYKTYGEKKFLGRSYHGIFRKTFLLGPDRTIVKVFEEVKPEGHAAKVLAFLDDRARSTVTTAASKKSSRTKAQKPMGTSPAKKSNRKSTSTRRRS